VRLVQKEETISEFRSAVTNLPYIILVVILIFHIIYSSYSTEVYFICKANRLLKNPVSFLRIAIRSLLSILQVSLSNPWLQSCCLDRVASLISPRISCSYGTIP
jgi:hypothetical protein